VDRVGSHEFAHQWWGHLVGWASYRDQWLSEGFAEFTSALVVEQAAGSEGYRRFWERARTRIMEKPAKAFAANDGAGPIIQGWRLATWRNSAAYQAMIYIKGAYVLQMLRTLMWSPKNANRDELFMAMMKDYVTTYAGKNPSTRDFQAVVERHMTPVMDLAKNGRMDWFFRQWVEGTEIPRYTTKLEIRSLGGDQYKLSGTVTQDSVSPDFHGFLPLYLEFDKGLQRLGVVSFTGTETTPIEMTLKLPQKPKRVSPNAKQDVLTRD
jgi:aminopeptidase N